MRKGKTVTTPGHRAVYCDKPRRDLEGDLGYIVEAEAATGSGHIHVACYDKYCSDFEDGVDYLSGAKAATNSGHTHAVHCDKSYGGFEHNVDHI